MPDAIDTAPVSTDTVTTAPETPQESGENLLSSALKKHREKGGEDSPAKDEAAAPREAKPRSEATAAQPTTAKANQNPKTPPAESAALTEAEVGARIEKERKSEYERGRQAGNREWDTVSNRIKTLEKDNLIHLETQRRVSETIKEIVQSAMRGEVSLPDFISRLDLNAMQRGAIDAVGQHFSQEDMRQRQEADRGNMQAASIIRMQQERHAAAKDVVGDTALDLMAAYHEQGQRITKAEALEKIAAANTKNPKLNDLIRVYNDPSTRPDVANTILARIYDDAKQDLLGELQDRIVIDIENNTAATPQHPQTVGGTGVGSHQVSPEIPAGEDGSFLISRGLKRYRDSR